MSYDLLIRNIILNDRQTDIAIKDGLFAGIGDLAAAEAAKTFDCNGKFVAAIPFYNTHTHAAMTLFQGFAEDLELFDWLQNHIWPAEAKLSDEDIYWGTRLATVQMIRSGTVYFNDSYWKPDNAVKAVRESGMRAGIGKLYLQGVCDPDASSDLLNNSVSPRIHITHAPHAIYTVSKEALQNIADMMAEDDLKLHIHVAETEKEFNDCCKEHRMTPVEYLDSLGLINSRAMLAHCVYLTPHDRQIIAERGAFIAHNPVSNMKLCSGLFDFESAKNAGCRITIGTDGSASNNDLSMLEEMKFAALTAKIKCASPTAGKVQDIFHAATAAGAEFALGSAGGAIAPGKAADMLIINAAHPQLAAGHNLIADLVYAGTPEMIDSVICDGKFIMEHGIIPQEQEIAAAVTEICRKIRVDAKI